MDIEFMALSYKNPQVFRVLQRKASKSKGKQKNFTKKFLKKFALAMRLVIDCLGLALKKKRCIITQVITELEHKHRTGFFSYCIIANNTVFTSDTDRHLRYRWDYRLRWISLWWVSQNLCCHHVFLWEIGEKPDDSKFEWHCMIVFWHPFELEKSQCPTALKQGEQHLSPLYWSCKERGLKLLWRCG